MESLLSHPAVQSAAVPFVVALVVLLLMPKIKPELCGLAAIAAFAATVALTTGFSFSPMTSTRKIILIAIVAAAIGLLLDFSKEKWANQILTVRATLTVLAVVATLWVIWPVLARSESNDAWLVGGGLSLYVGWIVFSISLLDNKKERLGSVVFAFSLGTAVVSVLAATALYGQLAAPFAAAAGVWILLNLTQLNKNSLNLSFSLCAALTVALLGAGATVYASLPWITIALLALIPLVVHVPIKANLAVWLQMAVATVASLIPVLAAIWYTVQQSSDSAYYG